MISELPGLMIENHRTVLNPDVAKRLIDILCDLTGHYPKKPQKRAPKKKAPIRKIITASK